MRKRTRLSGTIHIEGVFCETCQDEHINNAVSYPPTEYGKRRAFKHQDETGHRVYVYERRRVWFERKETR